MSRLICGMLVAVGPLLGQQVMFEAASIKPAAQVEGLIGPVKESNPARVSYRNYVLKKLVMEAYGVSRYQVEGQPWIERDMFDVMATKPGGSTPDQERQMLQNLLVSRFHLAQHTEKRDLPAYVLLPGKDTSKLHPVKESGDSPECRSSGTMAQFADILATRLDKPVVDETRISGRYYFILLYSDALATRSDGRAPPPPPPPPPPTSSGVCPSWTGVWPQFEASIFDAVREQMGLRLERKGTTAVNVIVLDHVEKPGPN